MNYLPMHAAFKPNHVLIFIIYVDAGMNAITEAGAAKNASAGSEMDEHKASGTFIAAGLVL
ncbi:hypothetical protein PDIG_08850 [Penicillium digitatum PHI26]|uniref:Uncharacterized protein n=3 Tax=Penicillium digitatum TaxID=36651 RepID=K9H047_PEND2|nr:hypothetical protein PDIP_36880 [Penicillium digitatum Pd1]EKV16355.1 hypothetical protein PDIP_36880 [Penicillium digitatum Pd1]EKV18571.1 hypothetical protein PDIG_08850 [Penicillium digitatum PHI26]